MEVESIERLIRIARGVEAPDMVIKGGTVVDVFRESLFEADVAVCGALIAGVGRYDGPETVDASGKLVCPGFIDGHVHIESSMVTVPEYSKTVVPMGTTSVVIDPHEIANVMGSEGILYMLKASKYNPLSVFVMLPSSVPSSPFETTGAELTAVDLLPFLSDQWVLGLGEVMNVQGLVECDSAILDKVRVAAHGPIDGHAPGLGGADLVAYVAAGIRSDHECTTQSEALERLRLGMYVMIREGSSSRNLLDLLPVVNGVTSARCILVTDDRTPSDLIEEGHMDHLVRSAVRAGVPVPRAVRMASFTAAQRFGLHRLGAVAPGYRADLVVADPKEIRVDTVLKNGQVVAQGGELVHDVVSPKVSLRASVNVAWLTLEDFALRARGSRMRVMGLVPDQIITRSLVMEPPVRDGLVVSDGERDLCKLAVIERHHASGSTGLCLVKGFGLRRGALASSVAHDHHNLVVAGTSDADMLGAAVEVVRMQGGLAVVCDGKVVARLPLPVAGLMSEEPLPDVRLGLDRVDRAARDLGVTCRSPSNALSFLSLPVVPELKLTDQGLVDVNRFRLVDLFL
jgi:adenine deaminase